jgi:hypothetical protein
MLLTGLPCSDNTLSRFSTTLGIIATMSAPPVTLKDASLRLRDASKQRYQMLREQAAVYYTQSGPYMKESWEQYRPRTLLQWTVRMIGGRDQLTVQTKHRPHTWRFRKKYLQLYSTYCGASVAAWR